uniref:Uncharacterized protein n=1 Tax=Oryza brachyantha TaxID=4533 RepID=J3MNP1_ORYBR
MEYVSCRPCLTTQPSAIISLIFSSELRVLDLLGVQRVLVGEIMPGHFFRMNHGEIQVLFTIAISPGCSMWMFM